MAMSGLRGAWHTERPEEDVFTSRKKSEEFTETRASPCLTSGLGDRSINIERLREGDIDVANTYVSASAHAT